MLQISLLTLHEKKYVLRNTRSITTPQAQKTTHKKTQTLNHHESTNTNNNADPKETRVLRAIRENSEGGGKQE